MSPVRSARRTVEIEQEPRRSAKRAAEGEDQRWHPYGRGPGTDQRRAKGEGPEILPVCPVQVGCEWLLWHVWRARP